MTSNSVPQFFVHAALIFGLLDLAVSYGMNHSYQVFYPLMIALALGLGMYIINRFKTSFGLGDILLILFVSTMLSMNQFLVFLIMTLLYSAFCSIVLVAKDRTWMSKYIPMVPFMYLAFVTALLFTSDITAMFARSIFLW